MSGIWYVFDFMFLKLFSHPFHTAFWNKGLHCLICTTRESCHTWAEVNTFCYCLLFNSAIEISCPRSIVLVLGSLFIFSFFLNLFLFFPFLYKTLSLTYLVSWKNIHHFLIGCIHWWIKIAIMFEICGREYVKAI